MATQAIPLDPTVRGPEAQRFEEALAQRIVGQEEAVNAVADLFQLYEAGLQAPGRPVGSLLFLGPTGSGKTRVVEAAAEILFGDPKAVIKVDCAEFQHSHEIAKLVGSPPGYLGHRETHPLITQESLARNHTDRLKLSILLFDEIEKASDSLWQLLLGILDKATLTLGDNRRVDLSQTLIFLTSNLGAAEINGMTAAGMGFAPLAKPTEEMAGKIQRTAVEAARRKFSPEFMNRLDKTIVFQPLHVEQLERILELELGAVQQRLSDCSREKLVFDVRPAAKQFLLSEGTDERYGARHLKRAIERHVVCPLANLIASAQVGQGDMVSVEYEAGRSGLVFASEREGAPARPAAGQVRSAAMAAARTTSASTAASERPCGGRQRRAGDCVRGRRRDCLNSGILPVASPRNSRPGLCGA
ncbi:MAG TPA: AAA family ATPase [Candidatus Acidoferrales bacterium]|nr:AAA family ATPase [Candidatus Acidoferrales bacterium]